jgi:general stress protein CsbA
MYKVMLWIVKEIVKMKSLEAVVFKSILGFQSYIAEYTNGFYNICVQMFTHTHNFIGILYMGADKSQLFQGGIV